jgi:uncharacterized repeat protein (TIGR01451 family)
MKASKSRALAVGLIGVAVLCGGGVARGATGFRVVTGVYAGNGANGRAITGIGFKPDFVIVKGDGATTAMACTGSMHEGDSKPLGGPLAVTTGRIARLDGDGFTVDGDASVNASGSSYTWTAFHSNARQMKFGSYNGNGSDNRSIGGLGFRPGYVIVLGENAGPAVQRFADQPVDAATGFVESGELTNHIQNFLSDGFQVGTASAVNLGSTKYHYVAFAASAAFIRHGSYVGDGVDGRQISGLGIKPSWVTIKRRDSLDAVARADIPVGDWTLSLSANATVANAIESVTPDGFQIGTDLRVNQPGRTYYWSASQYAQPSDLSLAMTVSDLRPNQGQALTYTVRVLNQGPTDASGISIGDLLPAGLVYQGYTADRGVYDPNLGEWDLGSLARSDSVRLTLQAVVDTGTAGRVITNWAYVLDLDQIDPDSLDDRASVAFRVRAADLELKAGVDRATATEGDSVTYLITVTNRGPDSASVVEVVDRLPPSITEVGSVLTSRGAFDPGTGVWTIGSIPPGDAVASLSLTVMLPGGSAGIAQTNLGYVRASREGDPTPFDRVDSATVVVAPAPSMRVDAVQPNRDARPGDAGIELMRLTVTNTSGAPRVLSRVTFTNRTSGTGSIADLDGEITPLELYLDDGDSVYVAGADTRVGTAVPASGVVSFNGLALPMATGAVMRLIAVFEMPLRARDGDVLDLSIDGPSRLGFDRFVNYTNPFPIAPAGGIRVDGMSRAQITLQPVTGTVEFGTVRRLALDAVIPANGYATDVLNEIHLRNAGDALPGGDIRSIELWSDGGNGAFDSGAGDDTRLGLAAWDGARWSLTGLAVPIPLAGLRVFASVDVDDSAHAGRTIQLSLPAPAAPGIVVASANDGPVDASATNPQALVVKPARSVLALTVRPEPDRSMLPGAAAVEVLRVRVANRAAVAETLTSVAVANRTLGPGGAPERDAEWASLLLDQGSTRLATGGFTGGVATLSGFAAIVAPGDSIELVFSSGASLAARDGDELGLAVLAEGDLAFSRPVILEADWPLEHGASFTVDGMSLAQLGVRGAARLDLITGSTRNLALDLTVPPNGYEPDRLEFLLVRNLGDALADRDIVRLEAWVDDGDGVFEPSTVDPNADRLLGVMGNAGAGWALSGIALPVPLGGVRVYVSCDVAADAVQGHTLRLALPAGPVPGIGMASGDDGPRDLEAQSPVTMSVTEVSRVVFNSFPIAPGTVRPGDAGIPLLHFSAHNTYPDSIRVLSGITLTRTTTGGPGATHDDLDGEIRGLTLHRDAPNGPTLATGFFAQGMARLTGFASPIAPLETLNLFVTMDLTLATADGDVISAAIASENDLEFETSAGVAGTFPVQSGAAWTVDGMITDQIGDLAAPGATMGPDDGPVLALAFTLPRNGYRGDVLEGVRLTNLGTATTSDLREMRLWKDGGNAAFDQGAGDDVDLGPMNFNAGKWVSQTLSDAVASAAGLRMFVSISTSSTPTDSAVIHLAIPIDGIVMGSGNDGPIDDAWISPTTVVLSTSHLIASFAFDRAGSVIGDSVTASLTVRNIGTNAIQGIVPSALAASGGGTLAALGGVAPVSLDLAPGARGTMAWTLRSDAVGVVSLAASVSGTEQGTGIVQRSLDVSTDPHRIYSKPDHLDFFPVATAPLTVLRGQKKVAPFTLTFSNPGDAAAADVILERLTLRLEDENGVGIAPSALLSRVTIAQGPTVYYQGTVFPGSGSTVDLVPSRPMRIQGGGVNGGQITAGLTIDLADSTTVQTFRLMIADSTMLYADDAVSTHPVSVRLDPVLAYPVNSGLMRVVDGADRLDVVQLPDSARSAGRGQTGVRMLSVRLLNPSPMTLGPDVRLLSCDVTLLDSTGAAIVDPFRSLRRLRVMNGSSTLLDRPITAADGDAFGIVFGTPITVPINVPVDLALVADLTDSAVTGIVRLGLADTSRCDARNATSGGRIPVYFTPSSIAGPAVRIQAVSDSMRAAATPELPATVAVGIPDVLAMTVTLRHPGAPEGSPIRCDGLEFQCRDPSNAPLSPAQFLHRVVVLSGGVEVGRVSNVPSAVGPFSLPLDGVLVAPGSTVTLEVRIAVEVTAPIGYFELMVPDGGIVARDVNLGTAVEVAADTGATFPLSSGITRFEAPPRELATGFADRMPAMLVADGAPVPVGTLSLRNTAAAGEILIDHLDVTAADRQMTALAAGDVCTRIAAYVADTLWAETGALAPGTARATLTGAAALTLDPGQRVPIEIVIETRTGSFPNGIRIGCPADGIGVVQPGSSLLSIAVVPEQGQTFPFWTSAGGFAAASLKGSYSNFPNPFAAGRSRSRFAFYLRDNAKVTLELWTVRGDRVKTLLDRVAFSSGLHQSVDWDGRNEHGDVVTNGAYIAEIHVAYDDGATEREVRKVAVVR